MLFFIGFLFLQLINSAWSYDNLIFTFFDPPIIIFIGLVITGVIITVGPRGAFGMGIKSVFSKNCSLPKDKLEGAVDLFKLLRKSVFYTGLLAFMASTISMLSYDSIKYIIGDPISFFAGFSVSLLGIYYALIINLIFFGPIIAVLQRQLKACKEE
jgi:hypothetical protein